MGELGDYAKDTLLLIDDAIDAIHQDPDLLPSLEQEVTALLKEIQSML